LSALVVRDPVELRLPTRPLGARLGDVARLEVELVEPAVGGVREPPQNELRDEMVSTRPVEEGQSLVALADLAQMCCQRAGKHFHLVGHWSEDRSRSLLL